MIYRTSLFGLALAALASCQPSAEPATSAPVAYPARSEAPIFRSLILVTGDAWALTRKCRLLVKWRTTPVNFRSTLS